MQSKLMLQLSWHQTATIAVFALALAFAALAAHAQSPIAIAEPTADGVFYLVESDGTKHPLEKTTGKTIQEATSSTSFSLQGEHSAVRFADDASFRFLVRLPPNASATLFRYVEASGGRMIAAKMIDDKWVVTTGSMIHSARQHFGISSYIYAPQVSISPGEYCFQINGATGNVIGGVSCFGVDASSDSSRPTPNAPVDSRADWKTIAERKLGNFRVTQYDWQKKEVLSEGTKCSLKKSGLVVEAANGPLPNVRTTSDYSNGVLTPEFGAMERSQLQNGDASTRELLAGDKVWLLKAIVQPHDSGIELIVITDLYTVETAFGDVTQRYWARIKIPIAKGATPNGEAIAAEIDDIIAPDDTSTGSFCNALKSLVSTPFMDIEDKVFLPNASLEPTVPNDWQHHTEKFQIPGDQVNEIHKIVSSCLSGYEVVIPLQKGDYGMKSSILGTDAPFNIQVSVGSFLRSNNATAVSISIQRAEDPSQQGLDFAKIAYVETASAACGWKVAASQAQNLSKYSITGLNFNAEVGLARKHIEQVGKLDFCDDEKEKAKFDKLSKTLWPLGLVGRP